MKNTPRLRTSVSSTATWSTRTSCAPSSQPLKSRRTEDPKPDLEIGIGGPAQKPMSTAR